MRVGLLFGSILLLVAGCTSGVQHADGPAAPITGSSAPAVESAGPAPTTAVPSTTATTSAPASPTPRRSTTPVLGPDGFGTLKLGMTLRQATATGLIRPWGADTGGECSRITHLKATKSDDDGFVYFSEATGVEIIDAYPGIHTPEGIGIGSTSASMRRAYPAWTVAEPDQPASEGRGYVSVPGNGDAFYRIVTRGGKVVELTLQLKTQNCYE